MKSLFISLAIVLCATDATGCGSIGKGAAPVRRTGSEAVTNGTTARTTRVTTHISGHTTTSRSPRASAGAIMPGYLTIHVVIERLPRLGVVLVDGRGRTLYAFAPDKHRTVTCTGSCAAMWPAFKLSPRQALDSSPVLRASLVGTVPDPEGGRVVTFAGWPLYTYVGDTRSGTANGQGLKSHGGFWYAVSRSGALVTKES
jgi:predicted lipoprotein with Yx(FWY)xxD motif